MRPRSARLRPSRFVLRLICAVACCGAFAASAQAATVGINTDITWGIPSSSVSQEVSLIHQAGVPWVRATIDLSGAEYYGPQLNMSYLSGIDAAVQAARNAGLNVLLELDRTPYWASADPNKYTDSSGGLHWNPYWTYSNPQTYARVVSDVVSHYKAMGVNDYELWNEPNNPSFWPSGVNAGGYVSLLKAAYPAVKAADPSATVVMAGLENDGSYPATSYLQQMYDAGAKGSYDIANFHIYPGGDPTKCNLGSNGQPTVDSFCLLDELRSEMTQNGDSSPVWVTELGWSTCTQSWCVTPQQQASYITSAFGLLATSKYSYVQKAFVYQLRDLYTDTSNTSWDSSLGVMGRDFTPKPAYAALQSLTSGSASTQSATTAPTVTLTSPTTGAAVGSNVTTTASASDPAGVTKVTFAVNGSVKATVSKAPYSATLAAKAFANGANTVTATAYDAAGRKASSSVTVTKATIVAARDAHISSAFVSLRLRRHAHARLLVAGKAAASSGRVALTIQRRVHGSWRTVQIKFAPLHAGRYQRNLRLRRGSWRVWAAFGASRSGSHVINVG